MGVASNRDAPSAASNRGRTETQEGESAMDWLRRFTEKWGWYTPGSAKSANEYLAAKECEDE